MSRLSKIWQGMKRRTGILVLVVAALLLETVFVIQYADTRARLSETLAAYLLEAIAIFALHKGTRVKFVL